MIDSFSGPYRFLSNFYDRAPGPTVEHLFQAAKTTDREWKEAILSASTPAFAKKLGRQAPMRPDWEDVKLGVMRDLLTTKFWAGTSYAIALLATGDEQLIEGNTWGDTYWGVCDGVGQNWLGRLLMEVRDELRRG